MRSSAALRRVASASNPNGAHTCSERGRKVVGRLVGTLGTTLDRMLVGVLVSTLVSERGKEGGF